MTETKIEEGSQRGFLSGVVLRLGGTCEGGGGETGKWNEMTSSEME